MYDLFMYNSNRAVMRSIYSLSSQFELFKHFLNLSDVDNLLNERIENDW